MQGNSPAVPVGITSKVGYGVTALGLVSAIVAYATGHRDQQTVGVIVSGAVAGLSLLSTQLGRYAQAHALIVNPPAPTNRAAVEAPRPKDAVIYGTGNAEHVGVVSFSSGPEEPGDPHDALPHHPVTDPATIPPDVGDGGSSQALAEEANG